MKPIRVSTAPRKARRVTEVNFEKDIGQIFTDWGLMFFKMEMAAYKGVPDRYVSGGNWIEFKSILFSRAVNLHKLLTPAQHVTCGLFATGGDKVFVCIVLVHEEGERFVLFMPWLKFNDEFNRKIDLEWMRNCEYIAPWKDKYRLIRKVFYDCNKGSAILYGGHTPEECTPDVASGD